VDSRPLQRLLREQSNVLTRRQALRFVSAKAIQRALEYRRLHRAHNGVYVIGTGPLTPTQHIWLGVLAAGADRCDRTGLGGLSALGAWGLQGVEPTGVHVVMPHGRRVVPPAGVHFHRTRIAPQLATHLRPPATVPGRAVFEAAAWARSDREARLIVAASFQQSVVTWNDIDRAAGELGTARRRDLVLATAMDCDGGSHSLSELDLLQLCRRERLPTPDRQVVRRDRTGRRRYVDAMWDKWKLAVEIDGAHHLEVAQMWEDAVKANALELDGYVVLRFPAFAVRSHGAEVAAQIREALRKAGWRRNRPL
jgi:very-short-patch-repair endonuclease